jgi:membrane associated rhomboid family serine protease
VTDAAPPQTAIPSGPSPVALLIAYDLVTRYRLRLVDQRDSRLGQLGGAYELGAASWTGERAAFVGFYDPPHDPAAAGHDLALRCEAARRWGHERLQVQGAKRCDILLVALRPVSGSLTASAPPGDPVAVGAAWVDGARGEAETLLPIPPGLPSVAELRARTRAIRDGATPPTLAAVDLAERQAVAGGYAQPVRRQLVTQPVATYGLIAAFILVFLMELGTIHPQQLPTCASVPCRRGLEAFGALPASGIDASNLWRLVSSAFLHDNQDFLHVAFNSLAMLWIGRVVEQLYGRLALLTVFLVSAVIGGATWVGATAVGLPTQAPISVGASGGIMGLVGLLLMLGRVQGRNVPVGIAYGIRRYAITVIVLTIGFGFLFPNVNNIVHVGGLATGAALGLLVPPLRQIGGRDLSPSERAIFAACLLAGAVALILAAANLVGVLQSGSTLV